MSLVRLEQYFQTCHDKYLALDFFAIAHRPGVALIPRFYSSYWKSRAASVEVLNTEVRSRTNSTSTTTSATTTSCLTANQKVQPDSPHRATIEPRPTFQPIMAKTASTEEKTRLPPLDSGPIFSRNRNRFGSSLTRYGSDTTVSQVDKRHWPFSSNINLQRNRTFDQVGDMGRYQYRQGPVGWKNPIQGL